MQFRVWGTIGLVAVAVAGIVFAGSDAPPAGVTQLLDRNAIPAIFTPQYVTADEADIPADAWVLGIAIDGSAHAYSLNLLNRHEIVNDIIADKPVAAVW